MAKVTPQENRRPDGRQRRHGGDFAALAAYLKDHRAGGYEVAAVTESVCASCGGRVFEVGVDDEAGCAERHCIACGEFTLIADSADYWTEAEPERCECPCGGDVFAVAVGFAAAEGDEVRWVSVGLRCLKDNQLGVYTDWKIDYTPSGHLRDMA